ncbi:MAG: Ribonuclease BN [Acidimicrobiales bacterium]|nr:Ribonuclease BN [Acidimicrobiales bacterium]
MTFYGVRGSTPSPCEDNRRYGGNTSCVALEVPGHEPIVFDLGTGLRYWGSAVAANGSFRGTALVTHLHWDHIQGLPFFTPLHRAGAELDVLGPTQPGGSLRDTVDFFLRPPYFPVTVTELPGHIGFTELDDDTIEVGSALVTAIPVPHIGPTNGYRVDWNGISVAYVPDHQQPMDGGMDVDPRVLELCNGVDLLIHDAQFDEDEFAEKSHWGHCTVDYAVHVAAESQAKRLVLFHHDPTHTDPIVDKLLEQSAHLGDRFGIGEVLAAHEGLTISFTGDDE